MTYLFGQTWLWLLLSFVLGAVVTWLFQRAFRKPKVTVKEERFTGPPMREKVAQTKTAKPTKPTDSALGALDDDERTMALKPPAKPAMADDDRTVAVTPPKAKADDEFVDDTPTGRIPVQSEPPTKVSGSLPTETTTAGLGAVGAVGLGAAGVAAAGAGKDFDKDSTTTAHGAESKPVVAATTSDKTSTDKMSAALAPEPVAPPMPSHDAKADTLASPGSSSSQPLSAQSSSADAGLGADSKAAMAGVGAGAVVAGAFANSAKPKADGSAPTAEYTVKGNADSMLYHSPESPYYGRTKAEVWFKTDADAEKAGFARWDSGKSAKPMAAVAAPTWEPGEFPGSAKPKADGSAPTPEFTVKGNADSMLYHSPESPYYGRTVAEVWFRTAADAEKAGFARWDSRRSAKPMAAVSAPTWEAGAYKGSAKPRTDGASPAPEFTVKGNMDSMLFHTEESAFYSVTRAEVWFRNAEDAEAAGFTAWNKVSGAPRGQTAVPMQAAATQKPGPFGPNSANPKADGSAPGPEYTVKGNADSMLFHTTESPYYPRTKAEVWFKTPADAERAGFTAWNKRRSEKA